MKNPYFALSPVSSEYTQSLFVRLYNGMRPGGNRCDDLPRSSRRRCRSSPSLQLHTHIHLVFAVLEYVALDRQCFNLATLTPLRIMLSVKPLETRYTEIKPGFYPAAAPCMPMSSFANNVRVFYDTQHLSMIPWYSSAPLVSPRSSIDECGAARHYPKIDLCSSLNCFSDALHLARWACLTTCFLGRGHPFPFHLSVWVYGYVTVSG